MELNLESPTRSSAGTTFSCSVSPCLMILSGKACNRPPFGSSSLSDVGRVQLWKYKVISSGFGLWPGFSGKANRAHCLDIHKSCFPHMGPRRGRVCPCAVS